MRSKTTNAPQRRQGTVKSNEPHETPADEESNTARPAKRKRTASKPRDKRYECPQEGCDKSYSRAEHLYRHQLNHAPKQIFNCDFEGCDRHFVRQDLCARHRERHTKENSHLYRRDAFKHGKLRSSNAVEVQQGLSPNDRPTTSTSSSDSPAPRDVEPATISEPHEPVLNFNPMVLDPRLADEGGFNSTIPSASFSSALGNGHYEHASNSMSESIASGLVSHMRHADNSGILAAPGAMNGRANDARHAGNNAMFARPNIPPTLSMDMYHLNSTQNMFTPLGNASGAYLPQPYPSPTNGSSLRSPPAFNNLPNSSQSITPYSAQVSSPVGIRSDSVTSYLSKGGLHHYQSMSFHDPVTINNLPAGTTVPVFNENYGPSPSEIPGAEFISWLFEGDQTAVFSPHTQASYSQASMSHIPLESMQSSNSQIYLEPLVRPKSVAKTEQDSVQPECVLSEHRRQRLLDLISSEFRDGRHIHVTAQREKTLSGDHNEDTHVLSLRMMQVFCSSFWLHIHPQLPILHRPTFSAETCPDLLLIAMMTLGASCLEPSYGYEVTQESAELASFLAWHTRRMIFEDPDFLPPAKLWIFQALLLLEVFEKMFSTTTLHQRAHVHHCTTLTLMRRGSSLVGRAALDFAPYDVDPTRTPPGPNGSVNTCGRNTKDEWWNNWISNEATRRTAFAAFIIDTTHATMFGHAAVMVAHEMRIPLPCDEALWAAQNGSEVRSLEHSLALSGYRPMSFLEALKKTLNSQHVQTNTFGRVTIMAGLMSVSWHMRMQDVRASSIGVGKQGSWSAQLASACDFWRRDFDASLAQSSSNLPVYLYDRMLSDVMDKEEVFESRTVLHHLARMAMYVDIVDCQILAGAKRSLGRVITVNDHAAASKKLRETWAPSHGARDAVFYALRFLSAVLLPESDGASGPQYNAQGLAYSARDDNLLNRPWVLYFAALVVWTYGFCLDGPIAPPLPTYTLRTPEIQFRDLRGFLRRVGGVKSADDLQLVKHRNGCLGLLMLLKEIFGKTRWELLHEASDMLGNCIELLMPGISNI
ncbi:hypothetical protein AUEXF2481DRAFT_65216 [Aureobasidium subglaciale EXF-2481]|uniref:C2H2-type domain-containing protein n=1 Tax=Aureobasidium subglaciale (strain EXF-2481) TaxID=1043005 RepID=A0A074YDF6_AURSE|nr:uncharacterized protein AUEXF2481DRAFT_65216 [Aureobasidium subglaciale EXF-2481]KAI5201737.1 hypothetical protein E4T38_05963 [Aureobasidium subglaciale]KAI5220641.1 hypothetical protein E4T40_05894 [Aureobasidium subglaciale]KAI5224207.1 hypothetical protein E4T41_05824 [Aureobasidium subglaciale]KAI5260807.1 hypothetical protein E4T46_05700 [Aureobasidium subglaciale]KEQ95848.1 hypothetical protein AUEXF2481DRAFT_65216 [Aureobasidium subglaciale EXF-2481]